MYFLRIKYQVPGVGFRSTGRSLVTVLGNGSTDIAYNLLSTLHLWYYRASSPQVPNSPECRGGRPAGGLPSVVLISTGNIKITSPLSLSFSTLMLMGTVFQNTFGNFFINLEYSGRFYTPIPEIGNHRSDMKETAIPF